MPERFSGRRKENRRTGKERRKNWTNKAWETPHAFELAYGKRRPGSDRRTADQDRRSGSRDRRKSSTDRRQRTSDRRGVPLPDTTQVALPIGEEPITPTGAGEAVGKARPRQIRSGEELEPMRTAKPRLPAGESRRPIDVRGPEPRIPPFRSENIPPSVERPSKPNIVVIGVKETWIQAMSEFKKAQTWILKIWDNLKKGLNNRA